MSLLTPWGYTLTDMDVLPDVLSVNDFNAYTAGKFSGDARILSEISAASQAVRNFCGWHVYPSEGCKLQTTFYDRRVTQTGSDILIQLPARFVSAVSSVKIGSTSVSTFILETNGLLRIYGVGCGYAKYTPIEIVYMAGLPESMAGALTEVVANRVTHALAQSYGVQSESAGGVSVTYSANWMNSASGSALPDNNKEVLTPYRLQGVF